MFDCVIVMASIAVLGVQVRRERREREGGERRLLPRPHWRGAAATRTGSVGGQGEICICLSLNFVSDQGLNLKGGPDYPANLCFGVTL
jgi:hypothetical protein